MPTKYIISKHTKKIQKGPDPNCIILQPGCAGIGLILLPELSYMIDYGRQDQEIVQVQQEVL